MDPVLRRIQCLSDLSNDFDEMEMIDRELKHDLLNKLSARGLWARCVKEKIRKGRYKEAQEDLSWIVKCTDEAIELLRKEG